MPFFEMGKDNLLELPKSMYERAVTARTLIIENPENFQFDDLMLAWSFCEEDGLWYSILGNYSTISPEEKRMSAHNRMTEYENRQNVYQKTEKIADKYYKDIIYQSKIREDVLIRDNYTCQECGKKGDSKFHVHHICRRKNNGSDCLDNLITLCPVCHPKKERKDYNPKWE